MSTRARKLRRRNKQRLRHGQNAAARHRCRHGRTGTYRAKRFKGLLSECA